MFDNEAVKKFKEEFEKHAKTDKKDLNVLSRKKHDISKESYDKNLVK